MSLAEIIQYTKDEDAAVKFLRDHDAIRCQPPKCKNKKCSRMMTEVRCGRAGGTKMWRCKQHNSKLSVRDGSLWSNSRLSLPQLIQLVWAWAFEFPITKAADLLGIRREVISSWYGVCRGACSARLTSNPAQIGGPGVVVQIDTLRTAEAKNNGDHPKQERWVFGGYCPAQNAGFLRFVPDRDANTLLPIIQQLILPGSIVHSEMLVAYSGIADLPVEPTYTHHTVNTKKFVDPQTGAFTNHVNSYWRKATKRIKNLRTSSKTPQGLDSEIQTVDNQLVLDEFLWRDRYASGNGRRAFITIMDHIGAWYPTP